MRTKDGALASPWFENGREIIAGSTRSKRLGALNKMLVAVFLFGLFGVAVANLLELEKLQPPVTCGMALGFFIGLARAK
ncbi:hypothetical protein [uncultured Tateyamaria sp.]|uniref:hypothetical protein n=1 Tax=uncultured Tateyamaria sp. TaxID=455651 RepID=UPI0026075B8F|nr:hypothetical protein [uncultured Tateyamaria sp.]